MKIKWPNQKVMTIKTPICLNKLLDTFSVRSLACTLKSHDKKLYVELRQITVDTGDGVIIFHLYVTTNEQLFLGR